MTIRALLIACVIPACALAQTVYQPVRHPVYDFLDRIEARYGVSLLQFSRPIAREDIATALDSLASKGALLRPYDSAELDFYRGEFAEELVRLHRRDSSASVPAARWNLLRLSTDKPTNSFLAADLFIRGSYEKRQDAPDAVRRANGVQAYGYVGDNLGAFMRWYDNGVNGIPYDAASRRIPEQGIVKGPGSGERYDFEVAEGQFTYSNSWIEAGLTKMDRWQGSARYGSIMLSDKAPSFPTAGFQIRITDWLLFEYFHGWLHSDIRIHLEQDVQKLFKTKYLASHVLSARPLPSLQVSLGESIVYGGTDVKILFLIPVISFRAADRWTRAAEGNSQFFADVRYTPIRDVTVYATGLIDELDIGGAIADEEGKTADYHLGYTLGALATDVLWPFVKIASETRLEFSRLYPYTYTNFSPTQWYTSHQVYLGHWIGGNADALNIEHIVHPWRGWDISIGLSHTRFGTSDVSVPAVRTRQPAFLYGYEYSVRTYTGSVRCMPLHDVWAKAFFTWTSILEGPEFKTSPYVEGSAVGLGVGYSLF